MVDCSITLMIYKEPIGEYILYPFYPYVLCVIFIINKCPNALNVHFYD